MKQRFSILWVEDKPRAVSSQVKEIEEYLRNKGFEPNIVQDESGDDVEDKLKEEEFDIVVTDQNLSDDISGTDVVNKVRKSGKLTDVLFYSTKAFDEESIKEKIEPYRFYEMVNDKSKIVAPLKKLIDKNLRRCNDIVFLRGIVISGIIDLELKVHDFFCKYFKVPNTTKEQFHNFFLENRAHSLYAKNMTLGRIIKSNGSKFKKFKSLSSRLGDLEKERNLLAHCKKDSNEPNVLVSMGKRHKFDRSKLNKILNNVSSLSKEFDELILGV